jgi:copper chaperone CopZ
MQAVKTITVPVFGLNLATCGQIIEHCLRALPGVTQADANYVSQTVTITFDQRHWSEDLVRSLLRDSGFACGEPMTAEHLLRAGAAFEEQHSSRGGTTGPVARTVRAGIATATHASAASFPVRWRGDSHSTDLTRLPDARWPQTR